MRIPLREQLALLLAVTSLLALTVLAVATWVQSDNYITASRSSALALTANLKAAEIAHTLQLYSDSVRSVGTRILLQTSLRSFNEGNTSQQLIRDIAEDLQGALSGGGKNALLLQAVINPRSNLTPSGGESVVNITGDWVKGRVELPYNYTNGTPIHLGDPDEGYPKELYPNLTYIDGPTNVSRVQFEDDILYYDTVLFLGPLYLNNSSSLISITVAINNNTSREDILGWLTVVLDAKLLYSVVASPEGLGDTGEVLIVGPIREDNLFKRHVQGASAADNADVEVWYVLPPPSTATLGYRHELRAFDGGNPDLPFKMAAYPAVLDAWSEINNKLNNAGAQISTHNEEQKTVSAGYAQVDYEWVDWILIFEQSHGEVIGPIKHLRDIILACIFAVAGAILLVALPLAHCAVKPIRLLQSATKNSVSVYQDEEPTIYGDEEEINIPGALESPERRDRSYLTALFPWKSKSGLQHKQNSSPRQHMFHIPQKVSTRRAIVSDELTDLIGTFNEMSDELTVQYNKLEERVKLRTAELEQSRNAAQVANESKTLFVANISHELRTPLNGILGMCSIALHERDTSRVRQALKIIYKSGDLLLHLLNDLLTFSRNSYGEHLAIEEETFHLVDIGTQITSIFEKQAREAQIDLKVVYVGVANANGAPDHIQEHDTGDGRAPSEANACGPGKTGFIRDISLRGDKHRILQILMNLVSNSLKFTPEKGAVEVRIKCLGYAGLALPMLNRTATKTSRGRNSLVHGRPRGASYTLNQDVSEDMINLAFQFEVEDTGPGVSEHMQEEIFKPFVQGDLALSKKYGGTGLGLAICSQLAALMHGKITLKSTISVGSTFSLSLNLRYLKEQAPSFSTATDRANSIPSMSKPNSMVVSSLRERAASRSPNRSIRRHSPSRSSLYSAREGLPRVVGYSQPYIADDRHQDDRQRPSTPPPSAPNGTTPTPAASMIHHKLGADGTRPNSPPSRMNTSLTVADLVSASPPLQLPQVNESRRIKDKVPGATMSSNVGIRPRVLVAEDNRINQEVVVRMLRLEKVTGKIKST